MVGTSALYVKKKKKKKKKTVHEKPKKNENKNHRNHKIYTKFKGMHGSKLA
jgi:hypothetical protein